MFICDALPFHDDPSLRIWLDQLLYTVIVLYYLR